MWAKNKNTACVVLRLGKLCEKTVRVGVLDMCQKNHYILGNNVAAELPLEFDHLILKRGQKQRLSKTMSFG